MTDAAWTGVWGFALMLGMIGFGIPIGFAMGIAGIVGLTLLAGFTSALNTVGIVGSGNFVNYSLSVVPLFVLMGVATAASGMSERLYALANTLVGRRRGGLASATIGSAAMFSAVCGSSIATAATMAKIAMPEMRRHAYDDGLASGAIAAGGALGILIPPSIILIVYSLITETPLLDLFAAALVPGLIAAASYVLVIEVAVRLNPRLGPAAAGEARMALGRALLRSVPVVVLFLVVLGGIYGGVFTPTEAAAVGAFAAFAYLAVVSRFDLARMRDVLVESVVTTVMIFTIVIGAGIFSFFLAFSGLPQTFAGAVSGLDLPPVAIALAIMVVYLVLGCFMESLGMMILTVPVLFPLVEAIAPGLGMTTAEAAVWFGVFVVIAVEIGLMTPPLGLNVFVIKGAIGDIRTGTIFRGVLPFWSMDVARLVLLILAPPVALWLPAQL